MTTQSTLPPDEACSLSEGVSLVISFRAGIQKLTGFVRTVRYPEPPALLLLSTRREVLMPTTVLLPHGLQTDGLNVSEKVVSVGS